MTMTVSELIAELQHLIHRKAAVADYPVGVAFRWKGDTVCSNIKSWCINGKSIQLNEEDFDRICGRLGSAENWIIHSNISELRLRREGE